MSSRDTEAELRRVCLENGLALHIKNHREHWIVRGPDLLAEWWPSTGRVVFGKAWKRAGHALTAADFAARITKRLPRRPSVQAIYPAYLQRLVALDV